MVLVGSYVSMCHLSPFWSSVMYFVMYFVFICFFSSRSPRMRVLVCLYFFTPELSCEKTICFGRRLKSGILADSSPVFF